MRPARPGCSRPSSPRPDRPSIASGRGPVTIEPVPVVGLEDHVLVVIEKAASSPPGYPRDPARRRNRPIQPGDPLPSA